MNSAGELGLRDRQTTSLVHLGFPLWGKCISKNLPALTSFPLCLVGLFHMPGNTHGEPVFK